MSEVTRERENNLLRLKESVELNEFSIRLMKKQLEILQKTPVAEFELKNPEFVFELREDYKEFLKELKVKKLEMEIQKNERILKTDKEGVALETTKIELMKKGINTDVPKEERGNSNNSRIIN